MAQEPVLTRLLVEGRTEMESKAKAVGRDKETGLGGHTGIT